MQRMRWRDLNGETTEEILQRLPVKSLVRFRCVCKSWGSRFRSPDFIEAHHRTQRAIHNANRNAKFLVKRTRFGSTNFFTIIDFSIDEEENVSVKENENIYFPFFVGDDSRFYFLNPLSGIVFGPCNGIVCVDKNGEAALWNPATREVKVLQPSTIMPAAGSYYRFSFILGFGYEPITDDYKVLRTVFDEQSVDTACDYFRVGVYRLELYSSNMNEWRLLCEQHFHNPKWSLCMDGVCHIFQYTQLLSFNLVDETFTYTEFPDCFIVNHNNELAMISVNNYVGMVKCTFAEGFLEIWVLKEIGVLDSWTKQATIGVVDGVTRFLGFLKEMILVEIDEEQAVLYNPKTQKVQTLQFNPVGKFEFDNWVESMNFDRMHVREYTPIYEMEFVDYVESLVSINGRQEQEEGIIRSFFQ